MHQNKLERLSLKGCFRLVSTKVRSHPIERSPLGKQILDNRETIAYISYEEKNY
jgi:hypothetical protein